MSWHYPASAHPAAKPHATAFSVDGDSITWGALTDATSKLAASWSNELEAGTVLAFPAHRSLRSLLHLIALIQLGVELGLTNPHATASELSVAVASLGATRVADEALLAKVEAAPEQSWSAENARAWSLDRTLARVLTSGTTGTPKAIPLSCEQVISSTLAGASRLGALPDDIWHSPLPWHHVGGLMVIFRALILGFHAELSHHFDPAWSAERLASGHVRLASFVPVMLERVLDERSASGPNAFVGVRAILVGGAAIPPALLERAQAQALPIARSWGMSETSSQIATASPGDYTSPLAPLPFVELSVEQARLVVSGPQVLGGRLVTSDRGNLGGRGVEILGRADDVFISGGENIDPAEIEAALRAHPDVRDALVVGVSDSRWGQRPVAFVASTRPLDPLMLEEFVGARLQRFKIPEHFFIVDDLPRNAMGKPCRLQARAQGETWKLQQANAAAAADRGDDGAKA